MNWFSRPRATRRKVAFTALTALAVVMGLGLLSACAFAQVPTGEKVVAVEIDGLKTIPQETVMEVVKVKVGDTLTEDAVRADMQAISDLGLFFNVSARFHPDLGGIRLVYEVVENPKVKSIAFKGNEAVSTDKLDLLMSIKPGEILNVKKLNGDLERILKYYYNEGYSARISDVNVSEQGDVTIVLEELRISDVRVEGNTKTKEYVIRRQITVKPGELLNVNKLRDDQRRLVNLGIFESVDIKLDPDEAKTGYIVTYVVKEAKTGSAAFGAGWSSAEGFIGYIEVAEDNFLGRQQRVNINWQFGGGQNSYELGFYDPWLDNQRTSLGLSLYSRTSRVDRNWDSESYQLIGESDTPDKVRYSEQRKGGSVSVGRPLNANTRASLSLRIDAAKLVPLPAEGEEQPVWAWAPGKDPSGETRSLTLSVVNDTRDYYMNPTSGSLKQVSVEMAGGILGGDYTFGKYQAAGSVYREVFRNQVLALHVATGLSTGTLPPQEQYRIGGAESLRGYDYGEFYGDKMVLANAEYRFQIIKGLQGVVFVDTGGTWLKGESMDLADLSTGAGAGVRIDTPIGMLRIDYGVGKRGGQVYFSFGQMF
ncbi:MAG TPA: BamA/TamA family outer membrane protein [Firmicutes bacterium]|nr:BamA/TamA family outer membrane protein [Bacillota bacterium]